MMKIYAAFLIVLLLILQYKFWFDKGGYIYNLQLQAQLEQLQAENQQLKARNLQLARKIILVKDDPNEIEYLARKNLGMIKEDEKFMFIIEDKHKQPGQIDEPPQFPEDKNSGAIKRE